MLYRDCTEDEGEKLTQFLHFPSLCADWCAVWCFHAGVGDSSSCLAEPFEFVVLTSLMCAHIALKWLWQLCPRIPPKRFLHCPQKTLAITFTRRSLHLDIYIYIFFFSFCVPTDDVIPLIVFSSMDRNDEPRFHNRLLFLTEKHHRLSYCAEEGKFCVICTPATSAILHCTNCTWLTLGGAGLCRYPVGKGKEKNRHYFRTDLRTYIAFLVFLIMTCHVRTLITQWFLQETVQLMLFFKLWI